MLFDDVRLAQLEALSAEELDELLFGSIRLSRDGTVVCYNTFESRLSGLSKDRALARNFFSVIAPCTNNYLISERFMTEPELDARLDYVFTRRMKPTPVTLR